MLSEPVPDLELVERMVKRLTATLGGDPAATDRARVLRLPGFRNLKYSDRPVARLLELHEERRYSIAAVESALPPVDAAAQTPVAGYSNRTPGPFDAHKGGDDVPQVMKDEVTQELLRRGVAPNYDGRLAGPCPFPGHTGQNQNNFYYSPISGRWWCFGEHHPGRRTDKVCAAGTTWSLWAVLFPGRNAPGRRELSTCSSLNSSSRRGEDADNSHRSPYAPPVPAPLEALREAPRHKRSAALLRSVGESKKAVAEANCGVPIKGKCQAHGVVRQGRASGKTPWCAGCNTETSAKYLHTFFPEGSYSILRLQRHLGPQEYGSAKLEPGTCVMGPKDGDGITALIVKEFQTASGHFRRVQRRFPFECLGWHFAVGQGPDGLWVELQVLVRHGADTNRVLEEVTGGTRKAALFEPHAVIRYDYPESEREQLRRDWAGLLKCALLRLEDDALFGPIFFALKGKQLSMAYGDLRQALEHGREETRAQQEDVQKCPVVEEDGKVCGLRLEFFLDVEDKHPINPVVHRQIPQK